MILTIEMTAMCDVCLKLLKIHSRFDAYSMYTERPLTIFKIHATFAYYMQTR